MTNKLSIIIAVTGIWMGFVGAISFMEAWLKFRAPGIDLQLGLGIGRLVFNALNKVEWVCFLVILAQLILFRKHVQRIQKIAMGILLAILLLQTCWLLPELDERALRIINHQNVPASSLHIFYIILECIKFTALIVLLSKSIYSDKVSKLIS